VNARIDAEASAVMLALVASTHAFSWSAQPGEKGVGARHKAEHDG
jgi:hypothetical protein